MTTTRDRCEVCARLIGRRLVKNRRRCADHLGQLALLPAAPVKRKPRRGRAEP